jgi:NADPH-dependent curcumin reductase CurA
MTASLQVHLAQRPHGAPGDEVFSFVYTDVPDPADGQVLLRAVYLSLDPYMRGWMDHAEPGAQIIGSTVCEVVSSRHPDFAVGEFVGAFTGWQSYALSDGSGLEPLDPAAAPISAALGVLGVPGFTAYAGLLDIGRPQPGETVVVAAAAGPVGSVVGQVARLKGARSVGIAGGADKCRLLVDEFGFDAAIDRRSPTLAEDLAAAVPDGVDVYFENVGGPVSREVYRHVNDGARVPVCGMVSTYNDTEPPAGPDGTDEFLQLIQHRSLSLQGFLHFALRPTWDKEFRREMPAWVSAREVRYREDIVEGLEQAPAAFRRMLSGATVGKTLVRVGTDPTSDPS